MNAKVQTGLGLGAVLAFVAWRESTTGQPWVVLAVVYTLAAAAAIAGARLPLWVRILATGTTAYLAYGLCLMGRTMEPHITLRGLLMAFLAFAWCALVPTLALLRAWRGRVRVLVVGLMFPVALALAFAVAAYEESLFVRQHPRGVGPTARWTVPDHWLSYDAERGVLSGSD